MRRLAVALIALVCLAQGQGHAAAYTGGPPYLFGNVTTQCDTGTSTPAGSNTCRLSGSADPVKGRLKLDLTATTPMTGSLPGAVSALGIGFLVDFGITFGGSRVPVAVTFHVNSAKVERSLPTPPETGSRADVIATATATHTECNSCTAIGATTIASTAGTTLTVTNKDVVVKFDVKNTAGHTVPVGGVVVFIELISMAQVGTPGQQPVPVAGVPRSFIPDVGSARAAADVTVTKFTIG